MTLSNQREELENAVALEIRADQLPLETIESSTSIDGPAAEIVNDLLVHGAKLLVGPRGSGKTHLMRYAWARTVQDESQPFALYVSFNRYLRLEPLLRSKSNALDIFHGWIICLCYIGLYEAINEHASRGNHDISELWIEYELEPLQSIVTRLERGASLPFDLQEIFDSVSLVSLKLTIERISTALGRKRTVVLLDDAALTLAPEYLPDFFDFYRVLKSPTISPKASVYPGTTEYGPRFHVAHEADEIQAWIKVDRSDYLNLMESIGTKRMPTYHDIPQDVRDMFKYAAFGIPRAYLLLLYEFARQANEGTQQSKVNTILDNFVKNKEAEFLSLTAKVPKFRTLISTGLSLFKKMSQTLIEENEKLTGTGEKQLQIGILEETEKNQYVERMLTLLIEAGLLYGYAAPVSHGKDRVYDRFIPHLANLIAGRAFSESRGFSPGKIVERLLLPSVKHPVRRSVTTLLGAEAENLKLDLPPCQNCQTARISDNARHCHNCGARLADASAFMSCMSIELATVPMLTHWQRNKLRDEFGQVRTVGDFLSMQDPGSELRKIYQIGTARATRIIQGIEAFVDEFLS